LKHSEIDPKVQDVIYDALFRGHKIKAKYQKLGVESASEYILNPLGLIVRDTSLNLVATISDHDNPLNFLLHRMKSVEIMGEAVRVPKGFSLDNHIQTGEMGIKKSENLLKLKIKLLTGFTKNLFAESPLDKKQKITTEPDGTTILEAEAPDTVVLRSFLLGFGSQIEVIEPDTLRKELLDEAEKMRGMYKSQT